MITSCIVPEIKRDVGRKSRFLGERYYLTFALRHEPSVCRLAVCRLSVTFVRPVQRVELFVNICALPNSPGTWAVCIYSIRPSIYSFMPPSSQLWRSLFAIYALNHGLYGSTSCCI